MRKRILSLLLAIIMTISLGVVAFADEAIVASGNCGANDDKLTWTLTSNGTLTISGEGEMKDYADGEWEDRKSEIKKIVIESGVTEIGCSAFTDCTSLTDVVIPDSVTYIDNGAFLRCTNLSEISLPDSVIGLGSGVFEDCTNLKSVRLPQNLTSIPYRFFFGCSRLKSISLPDSVTKIDEGAFGNCDLQEQVVQEIVSSDNITFIGSRAFEGNKNIYTVHIGKNVEYIQTETFNYMSTPSFHDCTNLTSITVSPENQTYASINGLLCSKDGRSLLYVPVGISGRLDVPAGIETIGGEAMHYAFSIKIVHIPKSVKKIGSDAFPIECTDVYYDGTEEQWNEISIGKNYNSDFPSGVTLHFTCEKHTYQNGVCTRCGAKDPNFKLAAPTVKPSYVGASGKPYIYWSAVDGAGKYYVYRSTSKDGTYEYIGYTTKTNYTDSKANAGYTYYYKVQAISSVLTMAKVYLSPSNQTDNCYAYGNTNEAVQCGKIADSCRIALERSGVTVQVGHMPSMQDKCKESNAFGADLHVPIHTNAFNGTVTGTRMFCLNSSGEGMKACEAIFAWLAPITPGTSENIQVDASLYEVRVPSAPTAYVECEFHDNATTAKWIVEHTVDIGEAIARGICDYFGVTYKEKEQPESAASTDKLYRAQEGAFANRPIAEEKNTANSSLSAAVAITCRCARPVVKPSYVGASGKPYIYWGAVDGANRYYVYRSTTKDGTYSFLGSTANLNYTDSKADAGTTYYYKVKAGIVNGVKINSSAAVAITCRCARPSVKITTSNGSPRLTWNAVAGANKYYIYRSTEANGIFEYLYSTKNLFYTNKSAVAGTTYYYKVKAVSKVKNTANSAFSTVVSIRAR